MKDLQTTKAMKHIGDLEIRTAADAKKYARVTEVTGYLSISSNAKLDALTSVGGGLYIAPNAKLNAKSLKSVGGHLVIYSSAKLDALTSVGGVLSINSNCKLDAKALTSVGGNLSINSNCKLDAPALYPKGFDNFKIYDGMTCVVLSAKAKGDIEILSCRQAKIKNQKLIGDKFFVAKKGEITAHADNIKSALEELAFKTGKRDIEKFRNIPKKTRKTPEDWAFVYRMVTGACQFGVKDFMQRKGKLKKTYTLSEILAETKGAFGHDRFKDVVGGLA